MNHHRPDAARPEEFTTQPLIFGAFGPDSDDLFDRYVSDKADWMQVLHRDTRARFAATSSLGLERTPRGWTWGRYVARRVSAVTPEHASSDLGLAGFWPDGPHPVVHTDWLGTQEVFLRTVGATTYWSNRTAPLIELGGGELHPNAEAWASFLILSGFWGSATPFREITRLGPSEFAEGRPAGTTVLTRLPKWLTEPATGATAQDVALAIEAAVPDPDAETVNLTLSGGLDSRLLLAGLLQRGTSAPTTWSTPHESGYSDDTDLSARVAAIAGTRNVQVDYSVTDWIDARRDVTRRLEHATPMHNWFAPLARAMQRDAHGQVVVDGLAGDVLMRYHHSASHGDGSSVAQTVWDSLGGAGFRKNRVFGDDVAERLEAHAYDVWHDSLREWHDHVFAESILRLLTRTRRSIASAPFRVFGPELRVVTPLIDPEVVRIVLAVPPLPAARPDLRRDVLAHMNKALSALPSTADYSAGNSGRFVERGASSWEAAQTMAADIRKVPEVEALFAPGVLDRLSSREKTGLIPWPVRRAATLADWFDTWRSRIAPTDFLR